MIKLDVLDCCHECDMFSSLEVKGSDKCVSLFGKIVPPDIYIFVVAIKNTALTYWSISKRR